MPPDKRMTVRLIFPCLVVTAFLGMTGFIDTNVSALVQRRPMKKSGNDLGEWGWKEGGKYVDDIVVVVGGSATESAKELIQELVEIGYTVWWRKENCNYDHTDIYTCREFYGYVTYLKDDDPLKPVASFATVFIHGHNNSWHSGYDSSIAEDIRSAAICAAKSNEYTPLNSMEVTYRWLYDINVYTRLGLWNSEIAPFFQNKSLNYTVDTSTSITSFQGGQWAVSPSALRAVPEGFWDFAFEKNIASKERPMYLQLDSLFWEQFIHLVFGNKPQINVYNWNAICKPPDDKFSNVFYQNWIDDVVGNTPVDITLSRSRQGIWTKGSKKVFVVLGKRVTVSTSPTAISKSLVKNLLKAGYGIWIRHPESVVCKSCDVNSENCGAAIGYLSFLTRNTEYVIPANKILFLRGDESFSEVENYLEPTLARLATSNLQFEPLKLPSEGNTSTDAVVYKHIAVIHIRSNWRTYVDSSLFREMLNASNASALGSLPTPVQRVVPRPRQTRFPRRRKVLMPPTNGAHFIVSTNYIRSIHPHYFGVIRDAMTQPIVVADMRVLWKVIFGMPLWETT